MKKLFSILLFVCVGAVCLPPATLAEEPPTGRAKALILVWLWGGASQLETFDPKPNAGFDYSGPFYDPIRTEAGFYIHELLPKLAAQSDKYSVIRSMTHGINAHETATAYLLTGRMPGGLLYPSIGSVVSYFKGRRAGYDSLIPPFIVVTKPQGRFADAGFLGVGDAPFATGGNPADTPFTVQGIVREGVTPAEQLTRRDLLASLDALGAALPDHPRLDVFRAAESNAYELILGDGAAVFDLSQESDETRDLYGRNTLGQSCLAARRLVESGVPMVMINSEIWDTHKDHLALMRQMLPDLDSALSALLQDLANRGMLEDTIVWCTGEFGRTPKIDWAAPYNGGRGHYGAAFSSLIAGGGFRPGIAIGETDAIGGTVVSRPVYPGDILGSIYNRLGIPADAAVQHPDGRMIPILPAAAEGLPSGGMLEELYTP